jgi:hypothetical protein
MSLLERVRECQRWNPDAYLPFIIAGRPMGRLRPEFARRLADFPRVFEATDKAVLLDEGLADFDSRTAAVHEVLLALREAGELPQWRDEPYAVARRWDDEPLMTMERGAVPLFGVRSFGVHLHGLVEREGAPHIWVAKRSMSKASAPGKLDHLVAGGQPHGMGIFENLVKECREEASIPRELVERARPVGIVSYICERPEGLRDDILFVYDLHLPEDFRPRNTDGEVEDFYLWPMARAKTAATGSEAFKFNCALCLVDLFLRLGLVGPDEPDYHAIAHGLRLED